MPYLCAGKDCRAGAGDRGAQFAALNLSIAGLASTLEPLPEAIGAVGTKTDILIQGVDAIGPKLEALDTELDPLAREETVASLAAGITALKDKLDALDTELEPLAREETVASLAAEIAALGSKLDALDTELDPLAREETVASLAAGIGTLSDKLDALSTGVSNVAVTVVSIEKMMKEGGTVIVGAGSARAEIWMTVWFDPVATKQDLGETESLIVPRVRQAISGRDKCRIFVEGHADALGSDLYNLTLSQQRVDYVAGFLDKAFPNMVDPNHPAKGERGLLRWTKDGEPSIYNRRVEIKIECPSVQNGRELIAAWRAGMPARPPSRLDGSTAGPTLCWLVADT